VSSNISDFRIFIGLTEIAGYYGRIVDELRRTGHAVTFGEIKTHQFKYQSDSARIDYRFIHLLSSKPGEKWSLMSAIKRRLVNFHFFLWAIQHHDVFVFVYGDSFWKNNRDLFLLRLLRKRIVAFIAHGSEARPAFMDGAHWSTAITTHDPIAYVYKQFKNQARKISRIEHYSDLVIANPLTSQLLQRPAAASIHIGLPPPRKQNYSQSRHESEIHILHAPSNRRAKGSDRIASIVQKVCVDYPNVLYTELTEVPNYVVLTNIARSHIIIDQMYSDTYFAGLGTEAASLGVAVLVGSYGCAELDSFLDKSSRPPAVIVHPDEIEDALGRLIIDQQYRHTVADECRNFVDSKWSIEDVSERFLIMVSGTFPSEWLFDPREFSYVHGAGLEESELKEIWKLGLERYGMKFLKIKHRSDLNQLMISLVN
jgi:hypothetical protein